MKRYAWRPRVILGALIVLFGSVRLSAEDAPAEPVRPATEIIDAWKAAGGEFGWMRIDDKSELAWWPGDNEPKAGFVPAFRFVSNFPAGKLKAIPQPEGPVGVWLQGTDITDANLKELAGLSRLHALDIGYAGITGSGLKDLALLPNLEILYLAGNIRSTEAGLKELGGLKQLRFLDLSNTILPDKVLKPVAGLSQLQILRLANTQLTDAGLKDLAGLSKLRSLDIQSTKVTDAGLKELASLKELQKLDLTFNQAVTDAGLKHLTGLSQLQRLHLRATRVSNASVKDLSGFSHLQLLTIGRTRVNSAGVSELRKALPEARIVP